MMPALHVERRPQPSGAAADLGALPVVMLHGWGMNLRVFDLLRDGLAPLHETWAIDSPGHGQSPWWPGAVHFAAQRDAVLAALPARCVLLGWSFGAKLAMELAARHPDRIASLVLIAASPKFAQSPDWPHGMAAGQMRAFREVLAQDWHRTLADFVWLQLRGSRNAEAARTVLESALAAHGPPATQALRHGLDLLDALDLRPLVPGIHQPVLVLSGQNDRVTAPGAARWLAGALPDARLLELPRAGHAPQVSHHEEVAAAVLRFLASQPLPEAQR